MLEMAEVVAREWPLRVLLHCYNTTAIILYYTTCALLLDYTTTRLHYSGGRGSGPDAYPRDPPPDNHYILLLYYYNAIPLLYHYGA